jgi:hypothetical protein
MMWEQTIQIKIKLKQINLLELNLVLVNYSKTGHSIPLLVNLQRVWQII